MIKKAFSAAVIAAALASPSWGAGASHWTHSNEVDFKKGKFENVVATNLGDLKLSRAVKTLLRQDPKIATVYCLAEAPDGTIYAGTGPQGIVLAVKGESVSTAVKLEDDENVFSILIDADGKLLVGTGGEKGRILRIDKPGQGADGNGAKPVEVFAAEGVQYVWKMVQLPDKTIYAATGPNGQLFQINPDGTHAVLFDCDENNIMSLISDGHDLLYAGTDPNGLVYRINRKTKDAFVLFDANESEITALLLDSKGNLYAGTGQASDTDDGVETPEAPGQAEKTGRPEGGVDVTPLPSPKPKEPKPPEVPKPNPGEPDPIPKNENKPQANAAFIVHPSALFFTIVDDDSKNKAEPTPPPGGPPAPAPGPNPGPAPGRKPATPSAAQRPGPAVPAMPGVPAVPGGEGNAIYRITPEGFVTEVFRQPTMVLSMIESQGALLVGTGSEGLIFQVNPAAEETLVLAKVDPKQVMSMMTARDGRILLGLANVGGIATLSSGFATEGNYVSPVLDATQISRFGKVRLQGSLPGGASLTIATRSGNLQEPGETGWSKWSDEMPAAQFVQVPSPAARFFQYRLSLASKEGKTTPVVDDVDVAYQIPNLAPQIHSIHIIGTGAASSGEGEGAVAAPILATVAAMPNAAAANPAANQPAGGRMRTIQWEVVDANSDAVEYTLAFRAGTRGAWITIQDKLKEPQFQWDTRGVSDGKYYLRVSASDEKANPKGEGKTTSRFSDPVVVDNTPPSIGDLKATPDGKIARVQASIVDRTSTVASVEFALDSRTDWQTVPASDKIFDSPEEAVSFSVEGLTPGAHQIALRATDSQGNQAFETVQVTVEK